MAKASRQQIADSVRDALVTQYGAGNVSYGEPPDWQAFDRVTTPHVWYWDGEAVVRYEGEGVPTVGQVSDLEIVALLAFTFGGQAVSHDTTDAGALWRSGNAALTTLRTTVEADGRRTVGGVKLAQHTRFERSEILTVPASLATVAAVVGARWSVRHLDTA